MAKPFAVTNTSPVIALFGLGELRLFDSLFEQVIVPFEVWEELADKAGALEPDALRALRSVVFLPSPSVPTEAASLHAGEAAAIALAVSKPGSWVVLDEIAARRVATNIGLFVVGTLGILVEAKRQGIVPAIGPLVEKMLENGCRLGPELVKSVLTSAGEMP